MIKIKVAPKKDPKKIVTIRLNARKTVDGNIMVYDHPHLDIAILTGNNKIVAMPKLDINDEVYSCIDRLFKFLRKEGTIIHDSLQGGNTFYSMEATFPEESDFGDPVQFLLFSVFQFLQDELPEIEFVDQVRDIHSKDLTDPNVDDSTEYGEVPPSDDKGSLIQRTVPWGGPYRTFQEGFSAEDQKLLNEMLSRNFSKTLIEQKQTPPSQQHVALLQRSFPHFQWHLNEDYGNEFEIWGKAQSQGETIQIFILSNGSITKVTITLSLFDDVFEKFYALRGEPTQVFAAVSKQFIKEFSQFAKLFGGQK